MEKLIKSWRHQHGKHDITDKTNNINTFNNINRTLSSLCGGVQNTSLGWNYKFLRRVAVSERQHSFGLKKRQMFVMLSKTLKKSIILFDNKYYSQDDGLAMGSSLVPTILNIFLCHHEGIWLKNAPRNSDRNITKYLWMILLHFLKDLSICNNLLHI